ncbi:MAG: Fic family protein [Proteobacteria bacterium]|nr:Fic family protein [Pseudomonadota bacterium]
MKRGLTGHYLTLSTLGETCRAFVPNPLPPQPPLQMDGRLHALAQDAALALGRLDAVSELLPEPQIFLYSYIRKEAVLSSQIEGTQSSLSDLLLFEAEGSPGVPLDDVREVSRYVAALERGVELLREGLPLSLRLIREIHAILLRDGRGAHKSPGEFRRSQNWIGGTRPGNARHVPPPPEQIIECMGALENFLHGKPEAVPVLIRAALAHVQFETIHPFLDGNGRVGRLLITFLLHAEGVLRQPLLYLSLYFKQHRERYYALLQAVRTKGDWEEWLVFFLKGVAQVATEASQTARKLLALFERHQQQTRALGRLAVSAQRMLDHLQRHPVTTAPAAVAATGMSFHTAQKMFATLQSLGLVAENTGRKYGKVYSYTDCLALLNQGTQPLR